MKGLAWHAIHGTALVCSAMVLWLLLHDAYGTPEHHGSGDLTAGNAITLFVWLFSSTLSAARALWLEHIE